MPSIEAAATSKDIFMSSPYLILVCNGDIGDKLRLAHGLSRKWRSLLEPRARGGCAPQRLPARILQRPAHRRMVVIAGEIVAGVELQTVTVGIPDIEKEGVRDAMPAGPALEILQIAARGHYVAQMQDVHGARHPIGKMVQARALAVGQGEVMHIALTLQPSRCNSPIRAVFLGIFRQAEAEPRVEIEGVLNFGGK